jgi:chromate transporter
VLPSLFILMALSWIYIAFGEMPLVAGCSTASSRP